MQYRRLDISDPKSVEEFGDWADAELRTVDVLVNNAGKSDALPSHVWLLSCSSGACWKGLAVRTAPLVPHLKQHMSFCSDVQTFDQITATTMTAA